MKQQPCTKCQQNQVCGYEYTVRRGDSFYLIANRLGVPLRDLLEANSDVNPARLMVGDVLCIPMEEDDAPAQPDAPAPQPSAQPSPAPEAAPEPSAQLPTDDLDAPAAPQEPSPGAAAPPECDCPTGSCHTLASGETAADVLLKANINLHTLQTANPAVDLSKLSAGQVLCVPETSVPCPVPLTYTLQTDETLESVALRLNASLSALLHANPCLAPGDFRAGMCIYVPED